MVRWWALVVALALATVSSVAAHEVIAHDLAGVALCVDEDSVAIRFERGGETSVRAVRERAWRALERILDGAGVPWRRQASCDDAGRGYVSLVLDVREAPWFGPRASAYELAVQVGRRHDDVQAGVRADPPEAFDLHVVEVFDEQAVGVPAVVYLPAYLEAGLRDLTVAWWLDHADAAPRRGNLTPWTAVAAGAAALVGTALIAAGALVTLRRMRRRDRRG